jgi:hypothetical protein
MSDRFDEAIARFDEANAADPDCETVDGIAQPKALLYARRMSECLARLEPVASEWVRLAVRSQHIRRWTIPRERYPLDRAGYRRWRTHLGAFHAETAGGILREVGYDEPAIARVQALLRKERLKSDPEAQLLEDVACLVFLEHYLGEFAKRQEEAKLVDIVRKTWRKMSPRGRAAARQLTLPPPLAALVARAVEEPA